MINQPIPCPNCELTNVIRIVYNHGDRDEQRLVELGEAEFAECEPTSNSPNWRCRFCNHQWFEPEEKHHSQKPWTFSMAGMFAVVTALAILFALHRAAGVEGAVLGSYMLAVSLGYAVRQTRIVTGGILAAVAFIGTYLATWLWCGNLETMDSYYCSEVRNGFKSIREKIALYTKEKGTPPLKLVEIEDPHFADPRFNAYKSWTTNWFYKRRGQRYDLYHMGKDRRVGGSGINVDIHEPNIDEVLRSRMAFSEFVQFEFPNGAHARSVFFTAALVVSMPLLVGSMLIIDKNVTSPDDLATLVFMLVVVATASIVLGFVMASFHISLGHSSGH